MGCLQVIDVLVALSAAAESERRAAFEEVTQGCDDRLQGLLGV